MYKELGDRIYGIPVATARGDTGTNIKSLAEIVREVEPLPDDQQFEGMLAVMKKDGVTIFNGLFSEFQPRTNQEVTLVHQVAKGKIQTRIIGPFWRTIKSGGNERVETPLGWHEVNPDTGRVTMHPRGQRWIRATGININELGDPNIRFRPHR